MRWLVWSVSFGCLVEIDNGVYYLAARSSNSAEHINIGRLKKSV